MMNDKQYNDFFRKKLDDFSSAVPDALWQNIYGNTIQKQNPLKGATRYAIVLFFLILTFHTTDELIRPGHNILPGFSVEKRDNMETPVPANQQDKTVNIPGSNTVLTDNNPVNNNAWFVKNSRQKRKVKPIALNTGILATDSTNNLYTAIQPGRIRTDTGKQNTGSVLHNEKDRNNNLEKRSLPEPTDSAAADPAAGNETSQRFFLYLFVSPDLPLAHVSAADKTYQQLRNSQASMQLSYSAGARLRINISSRLSWNTGVQYSQVNEKIQMQNKTSFNHYKSMDVPVLAGYQVYKNKFEIDVNGGIILNISSSYKGYISSSAGEPVNIRQANVYRNNMALSYYGGLHIVFNPNHKTSLFGEPYFRYQPRSIANSFQPFEEKIQKAGLLLGARYHFTK